MTINRQWPTDLNQYDSEYEQLNVFQFRLVGFYIRHSGWQGYTITEIANICMMSVGKCASTMRELADMELVSEHPGFRLHFASMVYLITDGNGNYKIGIAGDVWQRLQELQTGNASELRIIHQFFSDDALTTEKILHDRFKDKHVRLEWFRLNTDDVRYILSLEGGGS